VLANTVDEMRISQAMGSIMRRTWPKHGSIGHRLKRVGK
jgi:hypothetical protein